MGVKLVITLFCVMGLVAVTVEIQHTVCKAVDPATAQRFIKEPNCTGQTFIKNGQQGAKGPRGDVGDVGLPGTLDFNGLDDVFDREIGRRMCFGGLRYDNRCFKLPYTSGAMVNRSEAEELCVGVGASLADLRDNRMVAVVYNYINQTWAGFSGQPGDYVDVWLGLTYKNASLYLPTNEPVSLSFWAPQNRSASGRARGVLLRVGSGTHGLRKELYSASVGVPICN